MPLPDRPVAGAEIATDWGQEIHDRVLAPKGVQAHGAAGRTVDTTPAGLDLDTADEDPGGWLVGGDIVEVPTGAEGLYVINPHYYVTGGTTGQEIVATMALNGPVVTGTSIPCITSASTHGGFTDIRALSAGDQLSFQARKVAASGADPNVQLLGLSIVRIGNEIGA